MNEINRENYQAWFLDCIEGRLSANGLKALEDFLVANPDLRDELVEYESISLPPPVVSEINWEGLKQPGLATLITDQNAREELYFQAVEGQLNGAQLSLLDTLIASPHFAREYSLWQKTKLQPSSDLMARDGLYRLGLDRPIDDDNYEYYLIALAEGLLNADQVLELQLFAKAEPKRIQALTLAQSLRLEAPSGIFFPDKGRLYQNQGARILPIWWYWAAAIVLLLGASWMLWNGLIDSNVRVKPASIAETKPANDQKSGAVDSSFVKAPSTPIDITASAEEKQAIAAQPKPEAIEVQASELSEMMDKPLTKPAVVQVAEANDHLVEQASEGNAPLQQLPKMETLAELSLLEIDKPELVAKMQAQMTGLRALRSTSPEDSDSAFKTIPQWAAASLSRQLQFAERERDLMAMDLAKKLTERAGETLNSTYKKVQAEDSNVLTYTFKIGGVELSHSRVK